MTTRFALILAIIGGACGGPKSSAPPPKKPEKTEKKPSHPADVFSTFCKDVPIEQNATTPIATRVGLEIAQQKLNESHKSLQLAIKSVEEKGRGYETQLRDDGLEKVEEAYKALCAIVVPAHRNRKTMAVPADLPYSALLLLQAEVLRWHLRNLENRNNMDPGVLQARWSRMSVVPDVRQRVGVMTDWVMEQSYAIYMQYFIALRYFDTGSRGAFKRAHDQARMSIELGVHTGVLPEKSATQHVKILKAEMGLWNGLVLSGKTKELDDGSKVRVIDWEQIYKNCEPLANVSDWGELQKRAEEVTLDCEKVLSREGKEHYEKWRQAQSAQP